MSEYDDQNRPENGEINPEQPQNDQQQYYNNQYQDPNGQNQQYYNNQYQDPNAQYQQYYWTQGQYYQGPDGRYYYQGPDGRYFYQGPDGLYYQYDPNQQYYQNQQYYNNQYQDSNGQNQQYYNNQYQDPNAQNQQYYNNQYQDPNGQNPYWQNLSQNTEDEQTQRQRNRYTNISLISAVCGMLSLCCGSPFISILFGIIAVVTAILSRKGKPFTGRAMAGLILGIFAIGLGAVEWFYFMAFESLLEDPEFSSILNQMYEQLDQV